MNQNMKQPIAILFFILTPLVTMAQWGGHFLYGTITTTDGKEHTGSIRWNNEEALWIDYFQGIKSENKYHVFVSEDDIMESVYRWLTMKKRLNDDEQASVKKKIIIQHSSTDPQVISEEEMEEMLKKEHKVQIDDEEFEKLEHVWMAHFGDIKKITITGEESVDITLKNGEVTPIKSGSNDFNTNIRMIEKDLGELIFEWNNVDHISFSPSPKELLTTFGNPLFGTIRTRKGNYTGFIQWDADKSLDTDKLIGKNADGELAIEFKNISQVNFNAKSKSVILNSGRVMDLEIMESNDPMKMGVNIWIDGLGKIYFPPNSILSVEFTNPGKNHLPSYYYFETPEALTGKVMTNDHKNYAGIIAYDLDEEYDFELIQGISDGLYYSVTLRNIKEIAPYNANASTIKTRTGKTVLIANSHDVAESNSGILIFEEETKSPTYIKWENVNRVIFN